ncbi:MAG: ATP-binding protein [Cognatishimia sp.]|uniref:ATP-binding protein n=1 Tax=Cognatishimia sp. TaxID=2211648 RepID=UPI003B8E4DE3
MNATTYTAHPVKSARIHFRSAVGATLYDVRDALQYIKYRLVEAQLAAINVSSAEIVIAEVLNNVVKHAQADMSDGWFDIQCVETSTALHVMCKDNGCAMPGNTPPAGIMPPVGPRVSDLPEGGWGWSLVRSLTQNLRYLRVEETNMVSFKIPYTVPETTH